MSPILKVILATALVASTVLGVEPLPPNHWPSDGERIPVGGGSVEDVPSYLVAVKVSGSPLGDFNGTGAFITGRLVLTCYHNIRGLKNGKHIKIQTIPGDMYNDVSIEKVNPVYDLALLKVKDKTVKRHRIIWVECDNNFGTKVQSSGFDPTVPGMMIYKGKLNGRVFAANSTSGRVFNGHTARVVQGMSGGPLEDMKGRLVGINTNNDGKGQSISVRLDIVRSFLDWYNGPYTLPKVLPPDVFDLFR